MTAERRMMLEDTGIAIGLLTAAWYLYYLVGIGGFLDHLEDGPFKDYVTGPGIHVEMVMSGIGLGIILALVNHYSQWRQAGPMSFGRVIFVKSAIYLISVVFLGLLVNLIFYTFLFSPEEMAEVWSTLTPRTTLSLGLWMGISIVGVNFLMEIRRTVGPGNLLALLTGRYHRPREEDRVFLFVDLKGSTGIAEALGHERYSRFIRQCYHDLTEFVLRFGGQIYQYVGDEVVLSWPTKEPDAERRALDTFFAFEAHLARKGGWYEESFGVAPVFKAGVERGIVTATEVGDIKRDIAFHGDALNTAARLMALCGEYGRDILISDRIRGAIATNPDLMTQGMGEVLLKGKTTPLSIFGVSRPGAVET